MSAPRTQIFSEAEILGRVRAMARAIASAPVRPGIVVPVLAGAFVFAADLARALAREGLDVPVEFLWLRSYGAAREASKIAVLAGPNESVRGKNILLIDGVLDRGRTLAAARDLLTGAGASSVTIAVVVDKRRAGAPVKADLACFTGVEDFIVGYGMDDAGLGRGLPHIAKAG